MARQRRSGMAIGVAAVVSVVLIAGELLIRETGDRVGNPVSNVMCEIVEWATPLNLSGWACLAVPIAFIMVIALVIDTIMMGGRR